MTMTGRLASFIFLGSCFGAILGSIVGAVVAVLGGPDVPILIWITSMSGLAGLGVGLYQELL